MNIQNLSVIFTPAIFHDHNKGGVPGEWGSDCVLEDLIQNHETLFANKDLRSQTAITGGIELSDERNIKHYARRPSSPELSPVTVHTEDGYGDLFHCDDDLVPSVESYVSLENLALAAKYLTSPVSLEAARTPDLSPLPSPVTIETSHTVSMEAEEIKDRVTEAISRQQARTGVPKFRTRSQDLKIITNAAKYSQPEGMSFLHQSPVELSQTPTTQASMTPQTSTEPKTPISARLTRRPASVKRRGTNKREHSGDESPDSIVVQDNPMPPVPPIPVSNNEQPAI
jgi:hypothetical protein